MLQRSSCQSFLTNSLTYLLTYKHMACTCRKYINTKAMTYTPHHIHWILSKYSSAYHPQVSGQYEVVNRVLNSIFTPLSISNPSYGLITWCRLNIFTTQNVILLLKCLLIKLFMVDFLDLTILLPISWVLLMLIVCILLLQDRETLKLTRIERENLSSGRPRLGKVA